MAAFGRFVRASDVRNDRDDRTGVSCRLKQRNDRIQVVKAVRRGNALGSPRQGHVHRGVGACREHQQWSFFGSVGCVVPWRALDHEGGQQRSVRDRLDHVGPRKAIRAGYGAPCRLEGGKTLHHEGRFPPERPETVGGSPGTLGYEDFGHDRRTLLQRGTQEDEL